MRVLYERLGLTLTGSSDLEEWTLLTFNKDG
jgi:hypothetical protein